MMVLRRAALTIYMCGIVCTFGEPRSIPTGLLKHRGPDDFKTHTMGRCTIDYYRLMINDLTPQGMQPFVSSEWMLACNGEIYNYRELASGFEKSTSDCEVLPHLILSRGMEAALEAISGDFALVFTTGDRILAARDPVGVRPLFYTRYAKDSIAFASEVKALSFLKTPIHIFPPGHFYDSYIDDFVRYYPLYWPHADVGDGAHLKDILEKAVHDRIQTTERPMGFLLSGGLDSSVIAAIATKKLGRIRTFSIGLEGSPDLLASRKVAEYLHTDHTEVTFTIDEALTHVEQVIYDIESYDTTTVRASIPMWLLCKHIKEHTDCRYIFSGEGSDEIFGGYLYFHNAPNAEAFSRENIRRLRLIHQFDGLRADRCAAAHGLDLTVPFLDKHLIHYVMTLNQSLKISKPEKALLRRHFENDYLPHDILWRQKDGMSDAVGYTWVAALKKHGESKVSDREFAMAPLLSKGINVPLTKEEMYYRSIFCLRYENDGLISEIWRPRWTDQSDPSGHLLKGTPHVII